MTPLDVIRTEARAHRTVLIEGIEKDGTRERREIEPYSLRPGLIAERLMFWCLKRDGLRSLLVPNIIRAEPTNRSFVPRYPVEL